MIVELFQRLRLARVLAAVVVASLVSRRLGLLGRYSMIDWRRQQAPAKEFAASVGQQVTLSLERLLADDLADALAGADELAVAAR